MPKELTERDHAYWRANVREGLHKSADLMLCKM